MSAPRREWPYVEIDVPDEVADVIGSVLVDLGSNGVEQRDLGQRTSTLVAYFDAAPSLAAIARAVRQTHGVAADMASSAASTLRAGSVPDDDWLRLWKRGFEPTAIGRRLLVYPSWRRDDAMRVEGRVRIEVDPGMAFGTGTHETTRLCLEWLDDHWTGESLLDVGTGTGILAIAASLLLPEARIAGIDVDPVAIDVARENAQKNSVANRIDLRVAGPADVDERFDVVLANLTADVIESACDALVALLADEGTLVVSGVLLDQGDSVADLFSQRGLAVASRSSAGEWVALALQIS